MTWNYLGQNYWPSTANVGGGPKEPKKWCMPVHKGSSPAPRLIIMIDAAQNVSLGHFRPNCFSMVEGQDGTPFLANFGTKSIKEDNRVLTWHLALHFVPENHCCKSILKGRARYFASPSMDPEGDKILHLRVKVSNSDLASWCKNAVFLRRAPCTMDPHLGFFHLGSFFWWCSSSSFWSIQICLRSLCVPWCPSAAARVQLHEKSDEWPH